jgi:hypothetical protein
MKKVWTNTLYSEAREIYFELAAGERNLRDFSYLNFRNNTKFLALMGHTGHLYFTVYDCEPVIKLSVTTLYGKMFSAASHVTIRQLLEVFLKAIKP